MRRRFKMALLSVVVTNTCTTFTASAQSQALEDSNIIAYDETQLQQTKSTIAGDKQLLQEYVELVNSLKAELTALKKTPTNATKTAQVQQQLNRAQQVVTTLQTNLTNLNQWVVYWQHKEQAAQHNSTQDSLDGIAANVFDLNGDRYSSNEQNSNSAFARDQAEHDARLPHIHYDDWTN